jgi:type IV secretory pathway TrbL component
MRGRWLHGSAALLIAGLGALPVSAGDVGSEMKKAGKSIGKAAKEFGQTVAKESKKIGESVADATEEGAKTAWFETRNWATRESKHVAEATVRFWDDVIEDKESTRDRLRRENKTLKQKSAEKGK